MEVKRTHANIMIYIWNTNKNRILLCTRAVEQLNKYQILGITLFHTVIIHTDVYLPKNVLPLSKTCYMAIMKGSDDHLLPLSTESVRATNTLIFLILESTPVI